MFFKSWESLPVWMRTEDVKPFYLRLAKRTASIRIKRMLDFVLAFIMTVVLAPLMAVLAVCIKLDSRGPVFYRQERITRYGKPYRIFKFRTMVSDADKKGPAITQAGDKRITRMGRLLRKCRLDELPQLLNVLSGDMSFVGTRPEVKKYVDAYTDEMKATLLLPAGITSRSSIAYKDEDKVMERYLKETGKSVDEVYVEYVLPEKMKYNLQYLEEFGVFEDIKIMAETVLAVLR